MYESQCIVPFSRSDQTIELPERLIMQTKTLIKLNDKLFIIHYKKYRMETTLNFLAVLFTLPCLRG